MRIGWGASVILASVLAGCATSAGLPAKGFVTPAIARAYLRLEGPVYVVLKGRGAGVVIAPGIAVTNAHNANLVDSDKVIGISNDYDLLFFRTKRRGAPPRHEPYPGEDVIAYGQGAHGGLRMASGPVVARNAAVLPRCDGCGVQHAFVFRAEGGRGFSGGPVVDAKSGALVGIVFGFRNGPDDRDPDRRLMYAYDMNRVFEELARTRKPVAAIRP